jgi:MraZ protein
LDFGGHYEHSLDAKNRLSIPARFRAAFSSGVVLGLEADPCLTAWEPDAHAANIQRALEQLNPLSARYRQLRRFYQGNSFPLELDASGRVTLPPPLLAHAGIEKEVVVVGVGDHLELWDQGRWLDEQKSLVAGIGEVTEELGDPS